MTFIPSKPVQVSCLNFNDLSTQVYVFDTETLADVFIAEYTELCAGGFLTSNFDDSYRYEQLMNSVKKSYYYPPVYRNEVTDDLFERLGL